MNAFYEYVAHTLFLNKKDQPEEYTIIQIMPAHWHIFVLIDGEQFPIVCWALIEFNDKTRKVVGMIKSNDKYLKIVEDYQDYLVT